MSIPQEQPLPLHETGYISQAGKVALLLANRVLHSIDGCTERSFGATCSDLTVGPGDGESFVDDIRDRFKVVRAGHSTQPLQGPAPFMVPAMPGDFRRDNEIITVLKTMQPLPEAWILVVMHGVATGTHNSFIETDEYRRLIDRIASQHTWLEAITMLGALERRSHMPEIIG
jgi:hypothetical protein